MSMCYTLYLCMLKELHALLHASTVKNRAWPTSRRRFTVMKMNHPVKRESDVIRLRKERPRSTASTNAKRRQRNSEAAHYPMNPLHSQRQNGSVRQKSKIYLWLKAMVGENLLKVRRGCSFSAYYFWLMSLSTVSCSIQQLYPPLCSQTDSLPVVRLMAIRCSVDRLNLSLRGSMTDFL